MTIQKSRILNMNVYVLRRQIGYRLETNLFENMLLSFITLLLSDGLTLERINKFQIEDLSIQSHNGN